MAHLNRARKRPEMTTTAHTAGKKQPKPAVAARAVRSKHRAQADRVGVVKVFSYIAVFRADPLARVQMVRRGVDARAVDSLAKEMNSSREMLLGRLGLAPATFKRRVQDGKPLSTEASERVLGVAKLIGQVQAMVETSGDPKGFDAAAWVGQWLEQPLAALGGQRPAELMDTAEGQGIVANLLERVQSAAYA